MNPKKKKKKKKQTRHQRAGSGVGCHTPRRAMTDSGAAPSQPRRCFLGENPYLLELNP